MTNHLMLMPEPEEPFEEEEDYTFDDSPRTGKGFENLGSIHTVVLPPVVFERLGGKATLEEALWTCPHCGPIRPFAYANGFLPGRCACQRRAQEREQRLKVYAALQEQGQANRKRQCARCYTWLGDEWSEAGLEERTFAAFQRGLQPQAYDTARAFAEHQRGNILFIGSYGTGKCVAASEIITLANGKRVTAGELIGQEFELLTLVDGKPTPVKARAEFNALETVYEIEAKGGRHVIRNGDHPFWTARLEPPYPGASTQRAMRVLGWTPLRDIQPGDLIAATTWLPAFPTSPSPLSDTEIRVLAYLIGDGCYSRQNGGIRFSQQDNAQLHEFRSCVEEMGCSLIKHTGYDWRIIGPGRGMYARNTVIELLRRNDMMGILSRDKRFPSVVWSFDERQLALFLSRLFATDGWANVRAPSETRMQQAHIGYCSACRGLVEDVQEALMRLGLYSGITQKNGGTAWTLDICHAYDLLRFAEIIGIYGKEEAVERVVAMAKKRLEMPGKFTWYTVNAEPGTHWEKVRSVTPVGIRPTVAIEVPEHATFLTSFYEHNTHLAAAICNQLCDELVVCRFTTGQGLFDAIGHCISTKQDYHHLIAEAANVPVLVIDDIDKTYLPSSTDGRFQTRTFFDILDKRYKKKLPTIITTNEDDITPYIGKASFSRLQVGLVMRIMDGADYRVKLLGE